MAPRRHRIPASWMLALLLLLVVLSSSGVAGFNNSPPRFQPQHQSRRHCCRLHASAQPPPSPSSTKPGPRIVVIGAGVGGLTVAGRLRRRLPPGGSIVVLEQNGKEAAGGRLGEYTWEGHRWETGPSLLLLPEVYEETFAAMGGDFGEEIDAVKVEPSYQVVFGDDDRLDLFTDRRKMQDAIERLEPGAFPQYQAYLEAAQANLDFGFPAFIEERLPPLQALPPFLHNVVRAWPLEGHYAQLARGFKSEKLRAALSFQDLYIGLSPYAAPAVFSLLQAIELNQGVFYPKGGGFGQVGRALLRLVERGKGGSEGGKVEVRFDAKVEEVVVEEGRAQGVRLADGSTVPADVVVSNVDAPFTTKYLLPPAYASAKDHDTRRFSSSVVSFLWAFDKAWAGSLRHHNVFLAAKEEEEEEEKATTTTTTTTAAREAWEGLFERNAFDPERFNFYVHAPARTDPSVCPPGHDAIMILVPCPVLGPEEGDGGEAEERAEQELVAAAKEGVLRRFERLPGMADVRQHLIHERVIAPREWRRRYSLSRGAVFGLSHDLLQLSLLRPGPRSPQGIGGLYHVGASNRPGNGVPLCMVGARLLAELIDRDVLRRWGEDPLNAD